MKTHLTHAALRELRRLIAAGAVALTTPNRVDLGELIAEGYAAIDHDALEATPTLAGCAHAFAVELACAKEV